MPRALPPNPSAKPSQGTNNRLGMIWMLTSVIFASVMSFSVHGLAGGLHSTYMVLLRSSLVLIALVFLFIIRPSIFQKVKFTVIKLHIIRGFLIAVATQFGFYTLSNMSVTTATVLFFTAPIFATILAVIFHHEHVGIRRWIAIGIGFFGVLVVLRPGYIPFEFPMFTALASSSCFALALTFSRGVANADGALSALISSMAITAMVSLPLAAPHIIWPENITAIILVVLVATSSAIRSIADIEAYRYGEASVLAPISYLRVVFIGIGAYFFFNVIIDQPTIIGAAIIIGATLYMSYRARISKNY